MRLVGRDLIRVFARKHPDSRSSLNTWAQIIEANDFRDFIKLKETFRSADYVKPFTVFNISGNKYRLITIVEYLLQIVTVEGVLTHEDYERRRWRAR